MNKSKRKALEAKGWKVGSTEKFLRIPRKLKKKYKKMGLWNVYVIEGNGIIGLASRDVIEGRTDITEEDLWELVRSVSRV